MVIQVKDFSKSFGKQKAVDNLNFVVNQGEIFGFLGRNGAGKTTTFRTLIGLYQADEGELLIQGHPFDDSLRNQIGYMPEERGLYTRATVMDVLLYMGRLRGLEKAEALSSSQKWLRRLKLEGHEKKRIQQLSSGMQQKVQIIVTLMHKPSILILDEPFRGLDPVNRQLVYDCMQELKRDGFTILFSSHEIHEVEQFCDRVILMADGQAKAYGKVEDIRRAYADRFLSLTILSGEIGEHEGIEWKRVHGNTVEIRYKEDTDPQSLIRDLMLNARIKRFEIAEPSLNDVFLQLCGDEVVVDE